MKKWTKEAQSLWECTTTALVGLKRCGYLKLEDYENIITELQEAIDDK